MKSRRASWDVHPRGDQARRAIARDQPDRGHSLRRAVQAVDEHHEVVEDAMGCDPGAPYVGVHDGFEDLIAQVLPVGLADAKGRGEDSGLVPASRMIRVERIRDQLLRRDDGITRSRQLEPIRHRFNAMAPLGRARPVTRCSVATARQRK